MSVEDDHSFATGERVYCGELELVVSGPPDDFGLIPTEGYGHFAPSVLSREPRPLGTRAEASANVGSIRSARDASLIVETVLALLCIRCGEPIHEGYSGNVRMWFHANGEHPCPGQAQPFTVWATPERRRQERRTNSDRRLKRADT
jgi:hypothetical protein